MEKEIKTKATNIATAKSKPTLTNKATQGIKTTVQTVTRKIESTDDGGLQATALGIKTAVAGLEGIKLTGKMSENIVNGTIKTGSFIVKGAGKIKTGVTNTYAAVVKQGILNGTAPHVQIPSIIFKALKNAPVAGVKLLGKGALATGKFIGKGALKTGKTAVKTTWHGVKSAYKGTENALESSDDIGLQGIGVGAKSTRATIKTAAYTTKVTRKTVKTSANVAIKTTKTTVHAVKRIRKYGLKDTVKYAKNKMMKGAKSAAKNAGKALLQLLKGLSKKALIPILLVIFGVVAVTSITSNIITAVGSVFSGTYTEKDTDEEVDIHQFLMAEVENRKPEITDEILELREKALEPPSDIDVVRLQTPGKSIDLIFSESDENYEEKKAELTEKIVEDLIPTEKYVELLQPMFECLLLTIYDLDPTKQETKNLFEEVWSALTTLEQTKIHEFCSGPCSTCGERHAGSNCYNSTSGTHSSKTCSCDSTKNIYDENGNITGTEFYCGGYSHCGGHTVWNIRIDIGGLQKLLDKYFCNEIRILNAKATLTQDEQIKLEELKANWDLCLDYLAEFNQRVADGEY